MFRNINYCRRADKGSSASLWESFKLNIYLADTLPAKQLFFLATETLPSKYWPFVEHLSSIAAFCCPIQTRTVEDK
jgi:hypothetical protein